jgi:hypothetical protein
MLVAFLLRLGLGVLWFLGLPAWGHDNPVNQAGYIMEDAYKRDQVAWEMARSEAPLLSAFREYSATDQYGGLLFVSAAVYRTLGGDIHQPLMLVLLSGAFSSLVVVFTWAFARRAWGEETARLAAWFAACYPEAMLLGSSQMREPFTMALAALALYRLLRFWETRSSRDFLWMVAPVLVMVPLSPPTAVLACVMLLIGYLALDEWGIFRRKNFWIALVAVVVLAVIAWFSLDAGRLWLVEAANWQAHVSNRASGWVQRTFDLLPEWAHIPFLLVYGIFRPLLPAAVVAEGLLFWRLVGIWRALGWTVVLTMLFYAGFLSLRRRDWRKFTGGLLLMVTVFILVASYRGGGDQWDSPRYRAVFNGLQVALAAWALVRKRETGDPWLRRAVGMTAMMVFWFMLWYLRRYTAFDWSIVELEKVVGLGFASGILLVVWDWARK